MRPWLVLVRSRESSTSMTSPESTDRCFAALAAASQDGATSLLLVESGRRAHAEHRSTRPRKLDLRMRVEYL
jgi:hypothetical protein